MDTAEPHRPQTEEHIYIDMHKVHMSTYRLHFFFFFLVVVVVSFN